MRIAITGATGFLGKQLVDQLAEHELVLIGRDLLRLQAAFAESVRLHLHATDYSPRQLEATLAGCDALIHLAAKRVEKNSKHFSEYLENVIISEHLFAACEEVGVTNVVYTSTRSIYNAKSNTLPFTENQFASPDNPYAISKFSAELLGQLYNIHLKSLRIAQLVGPGEREGYMLMTFIQRVLNGEPLIVWGRGLGQREYLYVKDAAAAITAAVGKPDIKGVFNIGLGQAVSHREFAEAIVIAFDPHGGRVELAPDKPEDRSVIVMDGARALKELGWTPRYTLAQALAEMKAFYDS